MTALLAMVRKDLLLFFSDRRAVIMSFAVPIAIASFFGAIVPGPSKEPVRIAVTIVDEDGSPTSRAIVARAQADRSLKVSLATRDAAREAVRRGRTSVTVVVPRGFGDAAGPAFF